VKIIAIANQKGGVGKTSSTIDIGGGLTQLGKKVLLIDLDPQAHLTYSLGMAHELTRTIYQVLKGEATLVDVILDRSGVKLIPSTLDLIPELIVIVMVLIFLFGPIIAVTWLRKRYPNRLWIGIVLCLINGGIGQFYLPGGTKFFFLTFVLYMIFVKWIGYGLLIVNLMSAGIIYWRYLKLQQKPSTAMTEK
jgi:hypothetical protein